AQVSMEGVSALHACGGGVPGDLSSAAFFLGAALVIPGSELYVYGVGLNPTRTGVLEVLQAMGGKITTLNPREVCGEPVGDLLVRTSALRGMAIDGALVVRTIDELPVIAAVAPFAQ